MAFGYADDSSSMNTGNKIGTRRSTRVSEPPGGSSSVIIGGGEPQQQRRVVAAPPAAPASPNPINWGQLEAAPRSSAAVARAAADDRMKSSPFAMGAPSRFEPKPNESARQRPAAPFATGAECENVPQMSRGGRKAAPPPKQDRAELLAWDTTYQQRPPSQAVQNDRVPAGGRSTFVLGGNHREVTADVSRVPPGGRSSLELF
mmetsp:Transcript_145266/g.253531  ORF Transcript_145266/g.253531 Transcript_145266/m.253531 type:complete len:203 (-) Transcript_145266:56-664(-)